MHDQDFDKKDSGKPDHLLDELTSIRALLDSEQRATANPPVPLLDDVVGFAASFKAVDAEPGPALLDLEHIFYEGADSPDPAEAAARSPRVAFPKFTLDVAVSDAPGSTVDPVVSQLPPELPSQLHSNYRREALIQQLVAEFLPRIEATLRARLADLDDADLHALKKPD
jgi:hypothetical protein